MNFQKCVSTAPMILLAVTVMQAEVVAGRWEKVEALLSDSFI